MEDVQQKVCHHCHNLKNIKEFNKCKTGMMGLHNHCRSCQKEVRHSWYLKNKERVLKESSEYAKSEPSKIYRKKRWNNFKNILGPQQNIRRQQEPAKIKARIQRAKWYLIPHNRIAQSLRSRIRQTMKSLSKVESTEQLTGCSFEQLKSYLESKFLIGMTWNNYGQWHIDHIKPCASFDLAQESNQKICFHYTNLQPLWAKDNQSKGAKS